MDINEALRLARSKMDEHKLYRWNLKLIESLSVAGTSQTRLWNLKPELSSGTISLSRQYFEGFDHKNALNIILHEIAHALDEPRYKTVKTQYGGKKRVAIHHDTVWKSIARRIGCTGDRCVPQDAPRPKIENYNYRLVCPNKHESFRVRLTKSAKDISCGRCSKKFNPKYRFDIYDAKTGKSIYVQPKAVMGATTGRMSVPNLSQIPTSPPMVKKQFVPNNSSILITQPMTAEEWAARHRDLLQRVLQEV